jgi:hypothetical protein
MDGERESTLEHFTLDYALAPLFLLRTAGIVAVWGHVRGGRETGNGKGGEDDQRRELGVHFAKFYEVRTYFAVFHGS